MVATFLLVCVTCRTEPLTTKDDHKVSQLGDSVTGGLIITVMIYAIGHSFGAHMNPDVTRADLYPLGTGKMSSFVSKADLFVFTHLTQTHPSLTL